MATKVSIVTNPGNRISINNQLSSKISQLSDVDVSTKANNDVLVYEENSGKFVSKILPVVDGGSF